MTALFWIGKCLYCHAVTRREYGGALGIVDHSCPHCKRGWLKGKSVKGTLKAGRACDQRCHDAVGDICVCSCAGENHGKTYEPATEEAPA